MSNFTIWVDADACPAAIKEVIFKAAERTNTQVVLVANSHMKIPKTSLVRLEVVSKGADVADQYIVDYANPCDLAVTADIPLADQLVRKGLATINPRGKTYTKENIAEALAMRDFMEGMRSAGQVQGGPPQLAQKNIQSFANSFDRILTKKLAENSV